jgi:hypothetical protein
VREYCEMWGAVFKEKAKMIEGVERRHRDKLKAER